MNMTKKFYIIRQIEQSLTLNNYAMKKRWVLFLLILINTQFLLAQNRPKEISIEEQLMHSTVRIVTTTKTAEGHLIDSGGTGFFFSFSTVKGDRIPVIITNRHVIENTINGQMIFTSQDNTGNPNYGDKITVNLTDFAKRWVGHPNPLIDLCILPLQPVIEWAIQETGKTIFHKVLEMQFFPTEQDWNDMFPNTEIVMTGYPNGFSDKINNLPTFRKGIIANLPRLGFEGRNEFLIDIPIYGGSSGSPVMIFQSIANSSSRRIFFGGIVYAGPTYNINSQGLIIADGKPTNVEVMTTAQVPINFAYVIKSNEILGFVPIIEELVSQKIKKE